MTMPNFFHNPNAKRNTYKDQTDPSPKSFHSQLPDFEPTPLVHVASSFFGIDHVYLKDESQRLGLPSFKILGASWGTFRSIVKSYGMPLESDLEAIRQAAQTHHVHLVTATDGNHGRALAYMAKLLRIRSTIFVPDSVNEYTRNLIRGEGAEVKVEYSDYDAAVMIAHAFAEADPERLYIQDTSFEEYHDIPSWIVQGYTTMFEEVEEQLGGKELKATHILTPVGVGSLAHAVVAFCKSRNREISVIAVESEVAACLQTSLRSGTNTPISTKATIMDGINCGTVSEISWPVLRDGIDAAVTINDVESHHAVSKLATVGIAAGPCGASTTAALLKLIDSPEICAKLELEKDSVVVLLNTEGPREYQTPA